MLSIAYFLDVSSETSTSMQSTNSSQSNPEAFQAQGFELWYQPAFEAE